MKNLSGFSLIELLALISIVAILAAIALPNFSATIKADRDTSQINSVLDGLSLARSEAIKIGNNVTICAGNNNTCAAANWANGWIEFYNTLPPGATTSTIRVFPPISGNDTLTSSGGNSFTFNSTGMLTAPTPSTFILCDTRGPGYGRLIDLNITGRAETAPKAGYQIDGITPLPGC
ncbi:MAG TPA: GspH/FimT family pseudopilin [Gammaproteobacteria bacterium]|nr:GspH/FimT family pseudopilin [Gammaproteobacteria bacterium]